MAATPSIGLDIGTMSIRAAETGRGKEGPVITNFAQIPLPRGAVEGGLVIDHKTVAAALKQLWAHAKFRTKHVVLGITNPQIVVREMSVSNLPRRELRRSLPFQVRDALPLPVDKSLLDFFPLEDPGTAETVRGLLIAAPKEAVLSAVRATEKSGLHVVHVDLASFALLRAASRLDEKVEALVDIGARATSVVVHHDGNPLIVRTIPRGGAEITELIAGRLSIPEEQAEEAKCRIGLNELIDKATATAVKEAVRPLISEVHSSFNYLTSGERHSRVARLALSGGGSLLPGLIELMRSQLSVEVVLSDPVIRLRGLRRVKNLDVEPFRASAAVSIGLALGAA
jgi:type IV pilus assembly protein PilM